MKDTLAQGEAESVGYELLHFIVVSVEAVENPWLFGLVLFVQLEDVGSAFHVVDDQGLVVLFGKLDVATESQELLLVGEGMELVEACLADSCQTMIVKHGLEQV